MKKLSERIGWALAGALAVGVLLIAARAIQAGPLDPPGPVGSTMRTLADLVPAWDQQLTSNGCGSQRWTCIFGDRAVLDNETGLVWEKTPLYNGSDTWLNAMTTCTSDPNGGRYGWRLPSAEELLSLKDSNIGNIPANNPFTGVDDVVFWSSTNAPDDDTRARYITFSTFASNEQTASKVLASAGIWCVRGGASGQQQAASANSPWSRTLSASAADGCNSERFTCVLSNAAVLDHETGLVWERNPTTKGFGNWQPAIEICLQETVGGRSGWRPATLPELMSLLDISQVNPNVSLPPGHPFLGVTSDYFWSATEVPDLLRTHTL
jgi:uncharacterized protein DUF1566